MDNKKVPVVISLKYLIKSEIVATIVSLMQTMYSAKIKETYKLPNKENFYCDSSASYFYLNEKCGHKLIKNKKVPKCA